MTLPLLPTMGSPESADFPLPSPLPAPGELLVYDYRPPLSANPESNVKTDRTLKVLQWNVERNLQSQAILKILSEIDPDIAIIQEIDVGCKRSGSRNHMMEMASKLGWKGGYVSEFIELESVVRIERDQGGGVHGNAIFSRHDISFRVLDHRYHAFDWERDGLLFNEPRKGRRFTLVAEVQPPNAPAVLCYCVHLEVFTGIVGRVSAFSDILHDAHLHTATHPYQLIMGDLNTMANSIVRFSPIYATDRYRFLSFGLTEAEWWDRNVLDWHVDDGEWNLNLWSGGFKLFKYLFAGRWGISQNRHKPTESKRLASDGSTTTTDLDRPTLSGFPVTVLHHARNPGFYDPWSPTRAITLHNPRYMGIFYAKLDWTLLRGFECIDRWMGNDDYAASDHKYLAVQLRYDDENDMHRATEVWRQRRKEWRKTWSVEERRATGGWKVVGIGCLVIGIGYSMWRRQ